MELPRSFLSSLFDFSFSDLITPKIIKVLYMICVGLAGLGALLFLAAALRGGIVGGIVGLVVAAPLFILYVILARVYMEILIVIFRIAQDVRTIANSKGGGMLSDEEIL